MQLDQNNNQSHQNYSLDQSNVIKDLQYLMLQDRVIQYLKFKNTIYQTGNNIRLRCKSNDTKSMYGKIALIGKTNVAQFPVILVAWYYTREDPILIQKQHILGPKQLLLSMHYDWQYIESLNGMIKVLNVEQYWKLQEKSREDSNVFYCRGYLDSQNHININKDIHCQCLQLFNVEQQELTCILCGKLFHLTCSLNSSICSQCL